MKKALPFAALSAAFALSACISNGGALDARRFNSPDFGDSVRSNIAAESIPADPAAVNSPVEGDGARQSLAQQRYRNDKVKEPPTPTTSEVGSKSTGGLGSGGGGGGTSGSPGSY